MQLTPYISEKDRQRQRLCGSLFDHYFHREFSLPIEQDVEEFFYEYQDAIIKKFETSLNYAEFLKTKRQKSSRVRNSYGSYAFTSGQRCPIIHKSDYAEQASNSL
eukprot:g7292.t1